MFMGGAARSGGPNPFTALASRYGQKMGMGTGPRPGPMGGATGGFIPPGGGGLGMSQGPRPGPTGGATGGVMPPGEGGRGAGGVMGGGYALFTLVRFACALGPWAIVRRTDRHDLLGRESTRRLKPHRDDAQEMHTPRYDEPQNSSVLIRVARMGAPD